MSQMIVNSETALQDAIGTLRSEYVAHRYLEVKIRAGKDRTLDQNAISHVWYSQVSRELREDSPLGVKRYCKLHFGVPILRSEDSDFRSFYDKAIKPNLNYEEKILAMDHLPVTSVMTTSQLGVYLQNVCEHYIGRGVMLEFPEGVK